LFGPTINIFFISIHFSRFPPFLYFAFSKPAKTEIQGFTMQRQISWLCSKNKDLTYFLSLCMCFSLC